MSDKSFDLPLDGSLDQELALLLSMLDDSTKDWREELGDIDEDTIVWQVVKGGYSIGGILLHIADCETYWMENVAAGREPAHYDPILLLARNSDQYEGQWPDAPRKPLSEYYAISDRVREQTLKAIAEIADPSHKSTDDRGNEFTLRWILNHLIAHDSYSGGQIVMLSEIYKRRV